MGYKRAASARVLIEFVEQGRSPTVEEAVARAGKGEEIQRLREWRSGVLSHHAMLQALDAKLPMRIVSRKGHRGDFQMHSTWSDGAERDRHWYSRRWSWGTRAWGSRITPTGCPWHAA